jgi:hypothetical protein
LREILDAKLYWGQDEKTGDWDMSEQEKQWAKYYQKNRVEIGKKRKQHYLENKTKLQSKARANYEQNKTRNKERIKQRRASISNWFQEWKKSQNLKCQECGLERLECLDFHHSDKSDKIERVSRLAISGRSKKTILTEVKKCIVLCANCHRKYHRIRPTKRGRAWVWDYKQENPCSCGETNPACLDFHHLNSAFKKHSIANMLAIGLAKEKVLEEIAKCEIKCANCHRTHHSIPNLEIGVKSKL